MSDRDPEPGKGLAVVNSPRGNHCYARAAADLKRAVAQPMPIGDCFRW